MMAKRLGSCSQRESFLQTCTLRNFSWISWRINSHHEHPMHRPSPRAPTGKPVFYGVVVQITEVRSFQGTRLKVIHFLDSRTWRINTRVACREAVCLQTSIPGSSQAARSLQENLKWWWWGVFFLWGCHLKVGKRKSETPYIFVNQSFRNKFLWLKYIFLFFVK